MRTLILLAAVASAPAFAQADVIITADNAYGFGWGNTTATSSWMGGIANTTAGQIFNCPIGNGPEAYTVPAADIVPGGILYIVGWSDEGVTHGVIGQFALQGGAIITTGVGPWEVCPTGWDRDPGQPVTQADVNSWIARCNDGEANGHTQGARWLDAIGDANGRLEVGEDNSTPAGGGVGNDFPIVCGLDPSARWMWHNWDPSFYGWPTNSPFEWPIGGTGNLMGEMLIFRLPMEALPPIVEPDPFCEARSEVAECNADGDGWTATIVVNNQTGSEVDALHIPDTNITPNIIPGPFADGTTASVQVEIDGGVAPGAYCFPILFNDPDLDDDQACCTVEVCVELPTCSCAEAEIKAECIPGAPAGTFSVSLGLTNTTNPPTTWEHIFTNAPPPATVSPSFHDIPPTIPGGTVGIGPITVTGADPTVPFCLDVAYHDDKLTSCCEDELCFAVPPACLGTTPGPATPVGVGCSTTGQTPSLLAAALLLLGLRRRR